MTNLLIGYEGDDRFAAHDEMRDRVRGGDGIDRGRFDRPLDNLAGHRSPPQMMRAAGSQTVPRPALSLPTKGVGAFARV
jgi:hypothetical protein